MFDDDSDLTSLLSDLKSEVFPDEEEGLHFKHDNNHSQRGGNIDIYAPSTRNLSSNKSNLRDTPRIESSSSRHIAGANRNGPLESGVDFTPAGSMQKIIDPKFRNVVAETEKMGMKLSQEVQRQRIDLARCKEQNTTLLSMLRQAQSENELLSGKISHYEKCIADHETKEKSLGDLVSQLRTEKESMYKEMV
jgi:hypothetical protein